MAKVTVVALADGEREERKRETDNKIKRNGHRESARHVSTDVPRERPPERERERRLNTVPPHTSTTQHIVASFMGALYSIMASLCPTTYY